MEQPVKCRRCGRTLKNPIAVSAGIGKICARKEGISWENSLAQQKIQLNPDGYNVGDFVTLRLEVLREPAGTLAVVYEVYTIGKEKPGVSLITENGCDLGGFSHDEQNLMLEAAGKSNLQYTFKNVIQLGIDWRNGVFADIFRNAKA